MLLGYVFMVQLLFSRLFRRACPWTTYKTGTAECYFKWGGLSAEGTIRERQMRETSRGVRAACSEMPFPLMDRKRHITCQNLHAPSIEYFKM